METGNNLTAETLLKEMFGCLKYTKNRLKLHNASTHEIDTLIEKYESYSNQTSVPLDWKNKMSYWYNEGFDEEFKPSINEIIDYFEKEVLSKVSDVAMKEDELDAETIASIEAMADENFTAVKAMEFAEWISNNQFTCYNNIWTSTKIHYSPDKYTTDKLYDEFQRQQHQEFKKKVEERKKSKS